jgi:gastrin-releasing peptide receptor
MFIHYFKIIGFCLSFINSCVNPLALYFLSHQFRRYYNRYLFCWCRPSRAYRKGGEYSEASKMFNLQSNRHSTHVTEMETNLTTNMTATSQRPCVVKPL